MTTNISRDPDSLLGDHFDQYVLFRNGDTPFKAAKLLAAIFNVVSSDQMFNRSKWLRLVDNELFSNAEIASIVDGIEKEKLAISRLLAALDVWIFEDTVYLLTMRIEIEMLVNWLKVRYPRILAPDFSSIDEKIALLASDTKTKQVYDFSCKAIAKNWGLPISSLFFIPQIANPSQSESS